MTTTTTTGTTYREAMREAIRDALNRDDRVFLMGEDVGKYGGCFAVSLGLLEEFGPERIRDTPLSESAFVGAGIGAAIAGMRPIVEIMTVNFSLLALDQILNNAATLRHMSGGQVGVPLVIRMTTGAGRQLAAQHSHSLEGWYGHIPGLKLLAPATLEDARGMLWPALQDPDPVLIFEHGTLYAMSGELPAEPAVVDISTAAVRRPGSDVTLITYGGTLFKTLEAAEELASDGIDAEVIDLRVLRPLDDATIMESVRRTHRAVVVDEGWRSGSLSAEISARIVEQCFFDLDHPGRAGLLASRCRCPTRPTSSRPPCRNRPRSSPRHGGRWADERVHDAVAGRRHGVRHPAGVARATRRPRRAGRPDGRRGHRQGRGRGRDVRGRRRRHACWWSPGNGSRSAPRWPPWPRWGPGSRPTPDVVPAAAAPAAAPPSGHPAGPPPRRRAGGGPRHASPGPARAAGSPATTSTGRPPQRPPAPAPAEPVPAVQPVPAAEAPHPNGMRHRVSPFARRLAAELGVDLDDGDGHRPPAGPSAPTTCGRPPRPSRRPRPLRPHQPRRRLPPHRSRPRPGGDRPR